MFERGLTLHAGLGGRRVGVLGAEGGSGRRPHVADHLLGLDGDLLVAEQVGLHLAGVLRDRHGEVEPGGR